VKLQGEIISSEEKGPEGKSVERGRKEGKKNKEEE